MNDIDFDSLCKGINNSSLPSLRNIYNDLNIRHGTKQEKDQQITIITPDFDSSLYLIEEFMRYIQQSTRLPFQFEPDSSIDDQRLALLLRQVDHWVSEYKPFFKYSTYVTLFFEFSLSLPVSFPKRFSLRDLVMGKSMAEWGNQFVEQIRQALHSVKFKDRLRHREENARRSFSSSLRYVQHLFEQYSRLLVVRMDFALKRNSNDLEEPLDRILDYFSKLRTKMKRRVGVFRYLVGYIAHLEYSLVKGHHLHAIFFFNGNRVRNAYALSLMIGNLWRQITDNLGIYFNTHMKSAQYTCPAIGMIHRSDEKKRCCLAYVIWYITKLDQQLMYKYHDKQRVFFRGEIKK